MHVKDACKMCAFKEGEGQAMVKERYPVIAFRIFDLNGNIDEIALACTKYFPHIFN